MKQAISGFMGSGQQQHQEDDGNPWFMSTLAKAVGSAAGLMGMLTGIFGMLSLSFSCILAGAILAVEGLIVTLIEAPCFCIFLDFSQIPSNFYQDKPHYYKSLTYLVFAVIPLTFCVGFGSFLGCGLMLITSFIYLTMSIGRKASREQMMAAAGSVSTSPSAVLVSNEAPMATSQQQQPMKSGLTGEVPTSVTY